MIVLWSHMFSAKFTTIVIKKKQFTIFIIAFSQINHDDDKFRDFAVTPLTRQKMLLSKQNHYVWHLVVCVTKAFSHHDKNLIYWNMILYYYYMDWTHGCLKANHGESFTGLCLSESRYIAYMKVTCFYLRLFFNHFQTFQLTSKLTNHKKKVNILTAPLISKI